MDETQEPSIRKYLLGQLTEAESDEVELRLLSEPALAEEYDIIVNQIVDGYLAGEFSGEELKAVEQYFFRSKERQTKLRFAHALKQRKSEIKRGKGGDGKEKSSFVRYLAIAAAVALLAVGGFYVWRARSSDAELRKGLAALQAAFRDERPLEARISKFDYAPYLTTRGKEPERVDQDELRRAELTLVEAARKDPTPAVHHGLGKVYLARQEFDRAVKEFDEALKGDPRNAQVYNDRGAALLEKGKSDLDKANANPGDPSKGVAVMELAQSLDNFNKALNLAGSLPEALFNRALYHQYMRLWPQEEEDWNQYLKLDPASQWAEEAKRRLKWIGEQKRKLQLSKEEKLDLFQRALEAHNDSEAWEIISSTHNRGGNVIVEQLIDSYLAAQANGNTAEAQQAMLSLSYAANLERQKAGDAYFSQLAGFYAKTGPAERTALGRARGLMKSTHDGWGQVPVPESLATISQAKQLFQEARNSYESIVADYWASFCYYRQEDLKRSLSILEPLIAQCETNHYYSVLARLFYLMAGIQFKLNEHSRAIDFAARAADLAERTDDKVGLINALSSLIEFHRYLGDFRKALGYVQRGFGVVDAITLDPVQGTRHYGFEATAFASAGLFAAAADFQRIALAFALRSGLRTAISSNYAFLGLTNTKLGNYDEAIRNSQLAYDIAAAHSNERTDQNLMAYASLQMANASRLAGDFSRAIANYNRSIELYGALDLPVHLYQAHKGRLLCYIADKDDARAMGELSTAIGLVEKYRSYIFDENSRDAFFDTEQNIYDTAIDFEYSRMHNVEQAFQYSENSHARSLLDLINTDTPMVTRDLESGLVFQSISQPLSLGEIRLRLPPQVRVVQYAVLEDRLVTWVISREGVQGFSSALTAKELTEKVLAYSSALARRPGAESGESKLAARELFDILIAPVASQLVDARLVCFVPDKALNSLPFAALMSPSGRYLVQDQVFEISPSSSVFILCSTFADQKEPKKAEQVLSVGNPAFDRDAYPWLRDLPAAAQEAKEVADLYGTKRWLTESDATAAAVKTEMQNADVIHLALHSVVDEQFPLRSKLLLAKNKPPGADSLSALDVYGMNLSQTRLVVLSSCQTGAERYYKGEGMISLARPFIAARVPLVVASLWPVEAESTAELMVRFHQQRKATGSTVTALCRAQRQMLENSDPQFRQPYYWAAFSLIGGNASF